MPKISVIMLTYNRQKLVGRAIESVLTQTFTDFEYIIVDNGSTDMSGVIADEYALKDGRVKVIHRERGNIGSGRNAGLDAAVGEYITFIDDDDFAEPDFLKFLYMLAVENNADVSICGANKEVPIVDINKRTLLMAKYVFDERLSFDGEGAVEAMLSRKYFNTAFPTKLVKRSLFDGLRFPETGKYDDIALMYLVLARADNVAYHGLPKYIFSRHDDNNSNWTTDQSKLTADVLIEYLCQYKSRTEWLCARFPDKAEAWRYYEWSFMISMLEKITCFHLSDCNGIANDIKSELAYHKDEFICCVQLQDFERKWMEELQL